MRSNIIDCPSACTVARTLPQNPTAAYSPITLISAAAAALTLDFLHVWYRLFSLAVRKCHQDVGSTDIPAPGEQHVGADVKPLCADATHEPFSAEHLLHLPFVLE